MTPRPTTGAPAADAAGATRPVPTQPAYGDADAPRAGSVPAPTSDSDTTRRGSTHAGTARIVGVSLGHATLAEADQWIQELVPAPVLACTHLVSEPFPHVAISLLTARSFATAPELTVAAATAAAGRFGRAVRFPGVERLIGPLTVSEILQRSSIARVEILGSGPAAPDTIVETGDFVRPQFRDGELILVTTPAAGGRLVPFETRTPTPCCADH
ncbi:hypothetical protein [Actinoplanes xinjiangensis]|uniref:hypothetical protein n=1 Tax=Actinoplanes xinjiangensis TaxID=512350 RepID=UPI0034427423